jgi:quinoprotein glucose dehydrogenase
MRAQVISLGLLLGSMTASAAFAADDARTQWGAFGRDDGGTQYSPLQSINRANVAKLVPVWTHRSGDLVTGPAPQGTSYEVTPLHANNQLYYCTPLNKVFALDPATGAQRWVFDPHRAASGAKPLAPEPRRAANCRAVAYWEAPIAPDKKGPCLRRVFKGDTFGRLYAIDADTGRVCADFGADKGHPGYATHADYENHGEGFIGIPAPPVVVNDVVVVSMSSNDGILNANDGIIRAFDAVSGKLRWEWNVIPPERRAQTGAANVWSTFSADPKRGLVFAPTTSPSTDYVGGGRQFDLPMANATVALDARDGRVVWHFQTVRHDLFDYDLPGHPLLATIRRGGKPIDVAIQQTKMGWLFVFDRATGAPVFPIVERPVPKSDVPGDKAAPTQPVSLGIAAFARQTLKREDLFGLTPLDKAQCQRQFDEMRYEGMYTPPSMKQSLLFPSALGGGNWGGAAYDPNTNQLVIKAENLATRLRVVAKDQPDASYPGKDYLTRPLVGTRYRIEGEIFMSSLGMPCTPPPWGTLAAIDMDSGKLKWQVPLGRIQKVGVKSPASWGSPNVGGPMVTASGLIFVAATMDNEIRAIDVANGKQLWRATLPAPGMAVPMSYTAGGRQYVVIAAGGNARVGGAQSDTLVAFALPANTSVGKAP